MSHLHFACTKCKIAYAVSATDSNVLLLNKEMRCPEYSCGGKLKQTVHKVGKRGHERVYTLIGALELYQAVMGIGLPEERKCSPKNVRKMMLGSSILDVSVEAAPDPQRSIITSLTLNNGKVLHFTISVRGATIFKVTEVPHGR